MILSLAQKYYFYVVIAFCFILFCFDDMYFAGKKYTASFF